MRKERLLGGLIVATVVGIFLVSASPAFAVKQFYDEFKEVYVNKGNLDASAVAKAKCNICHEGKSKKDKNITILYWHKRYRTQNSYKLD